MPDRPALPHVWCDGAAPEGFGPSVVSVGVFDGVHRGHRVVVGRAAATAERLGVPLVVVTFDPNPAEVVASATAPTRLCSVCLRAELLVGAGADAVWVVPFTTDLSTMTPEDFVRMLVAHLAPAAMVVGADFRFGHRADGDVDTLTELGPRYGFTVEPVQMQGRDGDPPAGGAWSSTAVRRLLDDGDVEGAAEVLARPHRLEGVVVHGDHRGRELGFPTANVDVDPRAAVPADGVYAGWLVRLVRPAAPRRGLGRDEPDLRRPDPPGGGVRAGRGSGPGPVRGAGGGGLRPPDPRDGTVRRGARAGRADEPGRGSGQGPAGAPLTKITTFRWGDTPLVG